MHNILQPRTRLLFILELFLIQYTYWNHAFFTTYFALMEETPVGTLLGNLATKLPIQLSRDRQQIRFRLINNEHANYFTIDSTSGIIKVKERVDRESLCPSSPNFGTDHISQGHLINGQCQISFSVNILRFTQTGVDIAEVVRVIVDIQDIDDNPCEFLPSNHQIIHVLENNVIGSESRISLHRLVDLDTGYHNGVDYNSIRLQSTNNMKYPLGQLFGLEIDNTTSKIAPYALYLILNQPLDYEATQSYDMILWVGSYRNDSNKACFLNITLNILDANDHEPKFLKKSVHINVMENATLSEPIYTVEAHDLDKSSLHSKLVFELSSFNNQLIKSTFSIIPNNGSVFLRQQLRYSQTPVYQLSLTVRNLNPNEPAQSHWLTQPNPDSNLVNSYPSRFYDTMTLFVHVSDINDNSPSISVYTPNGSEVLTLQEEISSSTPVDFALISATDEDSGKNGQVICELAPNSRNLFRLTLIGYESGQEKVQLQQDDEPNVSLYKLSAVRSLDREQSDTVLISITCRDRGITPLETNYNATLNLIDINDNSPQFENSHIYVQVTEDSDPMRQANQYFIIQLNATDKDLGDNAKLVYRLMENNVNYNLIRLDSHTGSLYSTGKLDREVNSTLSVAVIVSDQGDPPKSTTATVHITILDYNDEFPKFDNAFYEFEVAENVVLGEFIGLLKVGDSDHGLNGKLNFRIEPQNYNWRKSSLEDDIPFKIVSKYLKEENLYEVRLFAHGVIDREALFTDRYSSQKSLNQVEWMDKIGHNRTNPHFEFLIRAEDSGTPKRVSTVTVFVNVLDLNDNAPRFIIPEHEDTSYRVSHLARPGDAIVQVKAVDQDADENGTVKYAILEAIPIETCLVQETGLLSSMKLPVSKISPFMESQLKPACKLVNYLAMDTLTGLLILHESLTSDMVGITCRLIIEAKDSGLIPSRSQLPICITITEDLYQDSITNQTMNIWNNLQQKRSGTFYLYIFTAIISMGLIVSLLFSCVACWIWRKSKLKSRKTIIQGLESVKSIDCVVSSKANSNMTPGTESITYQNFYTPGPNYMMAESSNEQTTIQTTPHHNWTSLSYADPSHLPHPHTLPSSKYGFDYVEDPFPVHSDLNNYHSTLQTQSQNPLPDQKTPLISSPMNTYPDYNDRQRMRIPY